MSEIAGIKPPIKEKIPQKEGINSTETPKVPEKVSPLKKASRAMRYVLDSTLDTLPFPTKSAAANKYLLEVAKDEKPELRTYKESVEAQEKKDVIVEAYGDEGPLEVLKGRESKVGRKVAVLVLGGGNGGIYNAALLLEMRKQGLLENADGMFAISSGAGNILAEGAGLGEDLVGVYGDENCRKVKVIDKKTKKEKEEGRFVKIPGADDPKGQINALKDAYVNGSDEPIISTSSVEEALRGRAEAVKKEKGIDLKEALKNNWKDKDLKVLVMDTNTTKSEFLDLKKVDDPIEAVGGAICVPGVSDKGSVNGKVDGAFSRDPIPLDKIFAMGYTDVVVLANGPAGESGQFRAIQVFLAEIAKNENGYGYNKDIIQLIRGHKRGSEIAAAKLEDKIRERNPNERVVVIGSAKDGLRVEELCTDSGKIEKVYKDVRRLSGERIFNRDVKLGSAKPADLLSAGEELKAMEADRKPTELKPAETSKTGAEATDETKSEKEVVKSEIASSTVIKDAGAAKVEEVKGEKPEESKKEGISKPEKPADEQIEEEKEKIYRYFPLGTIEDKLIDISGKTIYDAIGKGRDTDEAKLEVLKTINGQLDKYVPEKFRDKHGPKLPAYMVRIDNKTGEASYDPFYRPGIGNFLLEAYSESLGLGWLKKKVKFTPDTINTITRRKPDPAVVKELQDYYIKAKAAEEKKPA